MSDKKLKVLNNRLFDPAGTSMNQFRTKVATRMEQKITDIIYAKHDRIVVAIGENNIDNVTEFRFMLTGKALDDAVKASIPEYKEGLSIECHSVYAKDETAESNWSVVDVNLLYQGKPIDMGRFPDWVSAISHALHNNDYTYRYLL